MPKARPGSEWRTEPITDAQKMKLLVMLREAEIIEAERGCPLEEYEGEAVEWCNEQLTREITSLDNLTKGEVGLLFTELE